MVSPIFHPHVTKEDLDEALQLVVGSSDEVAVPVTVRVRPNFLTIELGAEHDPTILWIPMTNLLLAVGEVNRRVAC